jgi:hypothetical protein
VSGPHLANVQEPLGELWRQLGEDALCGKQGEAGRINLLGIGVKK